jgi:predicted metal-dependent phosphoesterase TrpH
LIVDFHTHTSESDGTLAPQMLCDRLNARGVRVCSITDHDTLGAYGKFEPPPGMRVVTGIEINTTYEDGEVHLLGYRLPLEEPRLAETIQRNRAARRVRVERIVEQLQAAGYAIAMSDVEAEAGPDSSLGRPHVGKALIRKGIAADIQSAFRRFLRQGTPGYVRSTHMTPHEAVEVITAAGGIAVLAHPGRLRDYATIAELADCGLQGLEVFYPTHEPALVQHFRDRAQQLGLVMTAGSDFHDDRYNKRGVGMDVDADDIRPFLALVS